MSNAWVIFKREFKGYFDSTIAYIFVTVFLAVTNGLYMFSFFTFGRAEMRSFFSTLPMFLVVFIPAITMRLWAEDKKLGTLELLLTMPMRTHEVVVGKFLAAFAFYAVALAGTLTIPVMLAILGEPDFGPIIGGYIGALLLGGFFLALGLFISGLCKDQIVAFILSLVACFALFMVGTTFIATFLDGSISGLGSFLREYVGVTVHFEGAERGVIDVKNIVYFLSMAVLFLMLNTYSLEGRKY